MVLMATGGGIFASTTFWVAVALVLFFALIWWKGRQGIASGLAARIDEIRREIQEAEQLKEEALALLAKYQRQHKEALEQAEAIVENAKAEAKTMKAQATKRLDEQLARREAQAMDKIRQAEENALKEVRGAAVDLAIAASERVLRDIVAAKGDPRLARAIEDLPKRLH